MNIITMRCAQTSSLRETLLVWKMYDVRTHGTCRHRQGDRCPIGMDVAIYCAHLGVVDRVHNKCVLVYERVAWHKASVRARRGSRRDYLACGACTPPRTGLQSEGEAGHREIRVARPLQPARAQAAPKQTAHRWPLALEYRLFGDIASAIGLTMDSIRKILHPPHRPSNLVIDGGELFNFVIN